MGYYDELTESERAEFDRLVTQWPVAHFRRELERALARERARQERDAKPRIVDER